MSDFQGCSNLRFQSQGHICGHWRIKCLTFWCWSVCPEAVYCERSCWLKRRNKNVRLEHYPTSWDYKLSDVLIFYLMMSPGSAGGERFSRFVKCDERAGSISSWLAELKCKSMTFWTSKLLFEAVKCKSTVAADLRHFFFLLFPGALAFLWYLKLVNNLQD